MMQGKNKPPGLILAGGLSRRMGSNKALSLLDDRPLLGHIIDRLVPQVATLALNAPSGWAEAFGLPLVPDAIAGHAGPLAGILAGLRNTRMHLPMAKHLLTVPADSPFFPEDLAARLTAHAVDDEAIVIAASSGQVHPVFGLWPVSLADDLERWLADDANRRIRGFLGRHQTIGVAFPPVEGESASIDPFFNINTLEELSQAQTFLKSTAP